jgi:hypothetical protein
VYILKETTFNDLRIPCPICIVYNILLTKVIKNDNIYITSIKGARRGSISKRAALNMIKSSIIQSVKKVGDIRSLTKTGYSLSKASVFFTFADPFLRS